MIAAQIEVIRSGEWLPADEQIGNMLAIVEESNDVSIDLAGVDYLDATSLQILLCFMAHQKTLGKGLELKHASPTLREWLDCAGASPYLQDAWSADA